MARMPLLGSDTPHIGWLGGGVLRASHLTSSSAGTHTSAPLRTPKAQANNGKRKQRAARVRGGGSAGEGPGGGAPGRAHTYPGGGQGRSPAATPRPGGTQGCGGRGGSGSARLGLHGTLSEPPAAQEPAARGRSGRRRGGGRPGPVAPAAGSPSPPSWRATTARRV